jgi:serine/threonine-protein kinase Chk2
MLTVNVEKRITVDECLEHPWLTGKFPSVADSTDGLTGAMDQLDFSRRKVERERTLLSSIVDVEVHDVVQDDEEEVKVFRKNPANKHIQNHQPKPGANRPPAEFVNLGGRGDQVLYEDDAGIRYPSKGHLKN